MKLKAFWIITAVVIIVIGIGIYWRYGLNNVSSTRKTGLDTSKEGENKVVVDNTLGQPYGKDKAKIISGNVINRTGKSVRAVKVEAKLYKKNGEPITPSSTNTYLASYATDKITASEKAKYEISVVSWE